MEAWLLEINTGFGIVFPQTLAITADSGLVPLRILQNKNINLFN